MKAIKYIIFVVVLAVVLFIGVGVILPQSSHVQRSAVIDAPKSVVFELVSDHREMNKWSPWVKKDPDLTIRYEGPETGIGSKMLWQSDEMGEGSSTFIEYEPYSRVATELDFGGKGTATAAYEIVEQDNGSKITWSFSAQHPGFVDRYFGLLMGALIGGDFEMGLADLKEMAEAMPAISKQEVTYTVGDTQLQGYLVLAPGDEPRPGVVVVHEWWGHNEHARESADRLAELGYNAFALDMFGDGKTADHPQQAMKFVNELSENKEAARARFDAALAVLKSEASTDRSRLAAIGYCFGGSVVLSMARSNHSELDGVVSFHGGLQGLAPIPASGTDVDMLVLNGEADPFVTLEQKENFKAELDVAAAEYEFIDYPGAVHAFTNPKADALGEKFDMPLKYDEQADADSWERMKTFLDDIL